MKKPLIKFLNKRVRKFKDTTLDLMFMLLSVLKSGCTWQFGAAIFRRKTSAFEKAL